MSHNFNVGDTVRAVELHPIVEMFAPDVLGAEGTVEEIHEAPYWDEDPTSDAIWVQYPEGIAEFGGGLVSHYPTDLVAA